MDPRVMIVTSMKPAGLVNRGATSGTRQISTMVLILLTSMMAITMAISTAFFGPEEILRARNSYPHHGDAPWGTGQRCPLGNVPHWLASQFVKIDCCERAVLMIPMVPIVTTTIVVIVILIVMMICPEA